MKTKLPLAGVLLMLLGGCSSAPASLQYYMLHSPSAASAPAIAEAKAYVQIKRIELPEYLKQRALVMQTSPTTLYFSPKHVWAEPLDKSFRQALTSALWQTGNVMVLPGDMHAAAYPTTTLNIHIDDFIATFDGKVLIKGQYWFDGASQSPQLTHFSYQRTLDNDGFEHAVEQMRGLVADVAEHIAKDLRNDS